jgi:beta-galactosidase/beta-glucuronidase
MHARDPLALSSVRPLVRFVDNEQAVVEACCKLAPASARTLEELNEPATLWVQVAGSDGFFDEASTTLAPGQRAAQQTLEIVEPERWWPAGMGEQPLYRLTVALAVRGAVHDEKSADFGLTSVRPLDQQPPATEPQWLVNGQPCRLHSVVTVDRVDENQLLPATGDSLLVVTDHYGPELLYQAADQAGILLVQCVPIDPDAEPERSVREQIDRLTTHPSLAGYVVGHLGRLSDQLARRLGELDPTRTVFRQVPGSSAA